MDAEPEDRAYTAVNMRGFGSADVWTRLPEDPETAVQKYSGGRPAPSRRGQDRVPSTADLRAQPRGPADRGPVPRVCRVPLPGAGLPARVCHRGASVRRNPGHDGGAQKLGELSEVASSAATPEEHLALPAAAASPGAGRAHATCERETRARPGDLGWDARASAPREGESRSSRKVKPRRGVRSAVPAIPAPRGRGRARGAREAAEGGRGGHRRRVRRGPAGRAGGGKERACLTGGDGPGAGAPPRRRRPRGPRRCSPFHRRPPLTAPRPPSGRRVLAPPPPPPPGPRPPPLPRGPSAQRRGRSPTCAPRRGNTDTLNTEDARRRARGATQAPPPALVPRRRPAAPARARRSRPRQRGRGLERAAAARRPPPPPGAARALAR
ncbi:translation initiation factor IF-2-like [Budorcas taxicolor]|uniref:translation initiation factor IF-2-like n=1 Tax=Budorcas taxicolor TaxID=37181 RepID=UPI0022849EEC|nr:translation initiation factor IF-2-like [Budorcas taxicolor]